MLLRAESSEWWGSGCLAPRLVALLHDPRDDAAGRVVLVERVRELLAHLETPRLLIKERIEKKRMNNHILV